MPDPDQDIKEVEGFAAGVNLSEELEELERIIAMPEAQRAAELDRRASEQRRIAERSAAAQLAAILQ